MLIFQSSDDYAQILKCVEPPIQSQHQKSWNFQKFILPVSSQKRFNCIVTWYCTQFPPVSRVRKWSSEEIVFQIVKLSAWIIELIYPLSLKNAIILNPCHSILLKSSFPNFKLSKSRDLSCRLPQSIFQASQIRAN